MRVNLTSHKKKLAVDGCVISDPFSLKERWLEESDSKRSLWPPVFTFSFIHQVIWQQTRKE